MASSCRQPVFRALRDQQTFELRNGSKDMEHQRACSPKLHDHSTSGPRESRKMTNLAKCSPLE